MKKTIRVFWLILFVCGPAAGESAPEAATTFEVESLAELDQILKNTNDTPVLLRVRADWNISGNEIDKHFASPSVQQLLASVVLVVVDVTDNSEEHRQFLARYEVFGPPWIMFFGKDGEYIAGKDIVGYATLAQLEEGIRDALEL